MTDPISKVVADDLCSGCGLCAGMFAQPAAEMQLSPAGFVRPRQIRPLNDQERQVFQTVCPGIRLEHKARTPEYTLLWGPILSSQVGQATDPEVRFQGSSGGVLSALAIYLLEQKLVDGVLHISASTDPATPFLNVPQISRTRDDVLRAAGSRYAPASPLTAVQTCLQAGGRYAFIGKPCDVAALRALCQTDARVRDAFPYLLSFMCAGTPSLEGTHGIVRQFGFEPSQVIRFRYRGNGWPGKARADLQDGRSGEMDYETSWGLILNRHLQFRCKLCPDGTGEFADVTGADAWHGDKGGYPTFGEMEGRSIVLGRTAQGKALLAQACSAGVISTEPLSTDEIALMQPYQVERKKMVSSRLLGATLAFKSIPTFRNLGLFALSRSTQPQRMLRNCVGTFLRALKTQRS